MNRLKVGDRIFVESYKHDGSLHRTWSKALVIDVIEHGIVCVTDHSWVVESDGRRWLTKEPAICFFYDNKWFNVISMIRKAGIYFYINLASPSLYDGEAIKNIDYDLDIKMFPDGTYTLLDENEYEYHSAMMNYPSNIKKIIEDETKNVMKMIENYEKPFDLDYINDYVMKYFKILFKEGEESEKIEEAQNQEKPDK